MLNGNKAPSFLRTHGFFARIGKRLTFGKIAQLCGKEVQTAEAWARIPASNAHPTGTGRKNPMDCVIRLMGAVHPEDSGLAREIAEVFVDYADFLDGKITLQKPLNKLIGASVKEHTEVVVVLLNADEPDFVKAEAEIVQAEIALRRLKEYVKEEQRIHAPLKVA